MQLAAYLPVLHLLEERDCRIVVVATADASAVSGFRASLGFDFPGALVLDSKRASHRALGFRSSVYASLVEPFRRHLKTFGYRAVGARRLTLPSRRGCGGSPYNPYSLALTLTPTFDPNPKT